MPTPEDAKLIHPLKIDEASGEVYLQLAAPYEHIVLTQQRPSDVPAIVDFFADPRVYEMLASLRIPYLAEHANDWRELCRPAQDAALAELRAGKPFVGTLPVSAIRDTSKSGNSIADAPIIGDCGISRHTFNDMLETGLSKTLSEENAAKEVGDPTIAWTIGNWLSPAYHGQGAPNSLAAMLVYMLPSRYHDRGHARAGVRLGAAPYERP